MNVEGPESWRHDPQTGRCLHQWDDNGPCYARTDRIARAVDDDNKRGEE